MSRIKESVCRLDSYRVPQQGARIKLNQNESALDVPGQLKDEILRRLGSRDWNRYPALHPEQLIQKLAGYSDFPAEGILVGNGSNELIQTIIHACCDSQGQITVMEPGFSVYERIASVMNIRTARVPLSEDFSFEPETIIERGMDADLVFIDSPNNPTGSLITVEGIRRIAESVRGLVIVDEAYYEFSQTTAQSLIPEHENIVILRTFSKALSLAGFRLGYLLAAPPIVRQLKKARLPFSVGTFQQIAGEVLLESPDWIAARAAEVIAERELLFRALDEIGGIRPFPSRANFIIFADECAAAGALWEALFQRGILLRSFDSPLLKNMLRTAVGSSDENRELIQTLKMLAKEDR